MGSEMDALKRVCIIGSGNFASAISLNIGRNVAEKSKLFHPDVKMWVYEEMYQGRKMTEIINTTHENPKYLSGVKLPENIEAVPDIVEAAGDADLLVFCLPHQVLAKSCEPLVGKIKSVEAISLIKGLDIKEDTKELRLISQSIKNQLGINVSVMMGANIANENCSR